MKYEVFLGHDDSVCIFATKVVENDGLLIFIDERAKVYPEGGVSPSHVAGKFIMANIRGYVQRENIVPK